MFFLIYKCFQQLSVRSLDKEKTRPFCHFANQEYMLPSGFVCICYPDRQCLTFLLNPQNTKLLFPQDHSLLKASFASTAQIKVPNIFFLPNSIPSKAANAKRAFFCIYVHAPITYKIDSEQTEQRFCNKSSVIQIEQIFNIENSHFNAVPTPTRLTSCRLWTPIMLPSPNVRQIMIQVMSTKFF